MQLHSHVTQVAEQLAATAALGDERTKELAAALATASASAVRLALLHAVSEAADEITAALLDYPGAPAVAVRLDGDELALDVHPTHAAEAAEAPQRDEGEASARITLRLSEALKTDIDAAAEREGISVNTWLVRLAANTVRNPFAGTPFAGAFAAAQGRGKGRRGDQHVTGWING